MLTVRMRTEMADEAKTDMPLPIDRAAVIIHRRDTVFWRALFGIMGVLATLLLLAMIWMAAVHVLAGVAKMLA